jgi:hypothetical protein
MLSLLVMIVNNHCTSAVHFVMVICALDEPDGIYVQDVVSTTGVMKSKYAIAPPFIEKS